MGFFDLFKKDTSNQQLNQVLDNAALASKPLLSAAACEIEGHRSHEIEDDGQPGQLFWCERCDSVVKIVLNQRRVTILPQLRAHRVVDGDPNP